MILIAFGVLFGPFLIAFAFHVRAYPLVAGVLLLWALISFIFGFLVHRRIQIISVWVNGLYCFDLLLVLFSQPSRTRIALCAVCFVWAIRFLWGIRKGSRR